MLMEQTEVYHWSEDPGDFGDCTEDWNGLRLYSKGDVRLGVR